MLRVGHEILGMAAETPVADTSALRCHPSPYVRMNDKALHSLAEDIEAEFGDLRRPRLQHLFTDAQLATLEQALDSALSGLSPPDRAATRGRTLDHLIRCLHDPQDWESQDRFSAAMRIVAAYATGQGRPCSVALDPLGGQCDAEHGA